MTMRSESSCKTLFTEIGKNLRAIRVQMGYSLDQVANQTGLSKSKVSEMERGEVRLNLITFEALASFFGVSMDYLVGKSTDPSEVRSAAAYTKIFKQAIEGHMNAIAVMSASAIVNSRSGAHMADELKSECESVIAAFDRVMALNPEFEEDLRGGANLMNRINELRTNISKHKTNDAALRVSSNPNEWARSIDLTQKMLSGMDGGVSESDLLIINRSLVDAANKSNPSGSLF